MYKARTIIQGHKLADFKAKLPADYANRLYVAVPQKQFVCGHCLVMFDNKQMAVYEKEALTSKEFRDIWGRNPYTLLYYEWQPNQMELFT